MKNLLLIIAFLFQIAWLNAQCPNSLIITSQEDIDNFKIEYPNCTELPNNFYMKEDISGNITNLDGLSNLVSIGGDFLMLSNAALTSFEGLELLEYIGGTVKINENDALVDFTGLESLQYFGDLVEICCNENLGNFKGLESLQSVGRVLEIKLNTQLINLEGLENLQSVPLNLEIWNNPQLQSLDGLSGLVSFPENLEIDLNRKLKDISALNSVQGRVSKVLRILDNDELKNLNGLNNLTEVGEQLIIHGNHSLKDLTGLESLITVDSFFLIETNDSLVNLIGLESLETVSKFLKIRSNFSLENLEGLESLNTVEDVLIQTNLNLENLEGLEGLTVIPGEFEQSSNINMLSQEGLENLTSVGSMTIYQAQSLEQIDALNQLGTITDGRLNITDCGALTNINGLSNLSSIAGELTIFDCESLASLDGLESLYGVESVVVEVNTNLDDIFGLSNVDFINYTDQITIGLNNNLSLCGLANICDYIANGGNLSVYENGPVCSTIEDVLASCNGDVNLISGQVIADLNNNCINDGNEDGIEGWLINLTDGTSSFTISTDEQGFYEVAVLEGNWILNVVSPVPYWSSCTTDVMVNFSDTGGLESIDFLMQPTENCAYIDWDFTMPYTLRKCSQKDFLINYCNLGTEVASDLIISIKPDSFLIFQESNLSFEAQADGSLLFEIGTLDLFECGQFYVSFWVDCDSLEIGDIQCIEVEVIADELCSTDLNWDESTILGSGYCENDSIYFSLENIGTGDMSQEQQLKVDILIDDIVLSNFVDDFQLDVAEKIRLKFPIDESDTGMRLVTNQTIGHPYSERISVIVPNCNNETANQMLQLFPNQNGNPYQETFCSSIIASFDPNLKSAVPIGVGINHEIEKEWGINYTLQFQNTGNDTAFLVILKDTLSDYLDLTTLDMGGSSHPYTWSLDTERVLSVVFNPIELPDSTTNEIASNGFVQFSIQPKLDLLPGDIIENTVSIYFDFNEPVITNTVFHTITKPLVASSASMLWCEGMLLDGVAIWQDTSIQYLTNFMDYDSVHYNHLEISEIMETHVEEKVSSGTYFENILIENDTSFTINYTDINGCDSLVTYTISTLTGLEIAPYYQAVQLFPNPTSGQLMINNLPMNEEEYWTINNQLGSIIWEKYIGKNELLGAICIKDFPSGIYWIQVHSKQGIGVWRIIKE